MELKIYTKYILEVKGKSVLSMQHVRKKEHLNLISQSTSVMTGVITSALKSIILLNRGWLSASFVLIY